MADKNYQITNGVLNGKLQPTVAVFKYSKDSHSDYWMMVAQIIEDWAKTHPNDLKEHLEVVKIKRAQQNNSFGNGSTDANNRALISLPEGLLFTLKKQFPELLEANAQGVEKLKTFAKKFPGFRVCEIV